LAGLTLGVIGLGHVGRAVAARAQAFEMRVIAVDAGEAPQPSYVAELWPLHRLPELLRQSDAMLVTAPLTPETRDMLGREQIALMKHSASLVAISRGGIVDETALTTALRAGHLAGAALDVQAEEPVPANSMLWDTPNLILTPHCSGESTQTTALELAIIGDNLSRFIAGEPLVNVVDTRLGY
jgi:phosphoglycerate dehydrogenase-like enzyme